MMRAVDMAGTLHCLGAHSAYAHSQKIASWLRARAYKSGNYEAQCFSGGSRSAMVPMVLGSTQLTRLVLHWHAKYTLYSLLMASREVRTTQEGVPVYYSEALPARQ
ncbi:hypothetical protein DENSPDRAFT_139191 [Dentipellis sp. KUC8613]|nr:hypothetical protein DENSPDRAFT_139191 [Dentipellis sp. KUC8613]